MITKSSEFLMGAKDIMPHHLGVFPFGLVFGVIAMTSGLSILEAILMSSIIFGGASQIVFVQLWSVGVPSFIVGSSVAIVNLRHLLYSASLAKYVESLPLRWRMLLAYLLTDQSYSVMVQKYRTEEFSQYNHYYFLGSGLTLWAGWQIATIFGVLGASFISEEWSLTFAISLTFIAIVIPLLKTRADLIACLTAGILSIVLQPLPWKLWLIFAGLGGITAGWIATTIIQRNKEL
jgi:predicted branched-subunit amino acid permease|tara:strand:- start:56 stop:757 length:702 start_codon:yes stop_codon:yes gene_type:complete